MLVRWASSSALNGQVPGLLDNGSAAGIVEHALVCQPALGRYCSGCWRECCCCCWAVGAAAQKKTTETAMQKQATATHRLSRLHTVIAPRPPPPALVLPAHSLADCLLPAGNPAVHQAGSACGCGSAAVGAAPSGAHALLQGSSPWAGRVGGCMLARWVLAASCMSANLPHQPPPLLFLHHFHSSLPLSSAVAGGGAAQRRGQLEPSG